MSQDLPEQPYGQAPTPPPPPPPPPYQQGDGSTPAQPTYGNAQPAYGAAQPALSDADQRMWSMLAHLGGILFGFLAPLIVYLVQRERGEFVKKQSTEALNWQITMAIGQAVSALLWIVIVGIVGTIGFSIATIVFGIIAGLAVNRGEDYRYPFALRLVK